MPRGRVIPDRFGNWLLFFKFAVGWAAPSARRGFTTTGFFLPVFRGMICIERYLRLEIACHQGKEESVSYNLL